MGRVSVSKDRVDLAGVIACHECDALNRINDINLGHKATCRRCHATLYVEKKNSINRTLALALTGLVLFLVANLFPFLGFEFHGKANFNKLITGVIEFFSVGLWELAILVFLTSIFLPFCQIVFILCLVIPLKMGKVPKHAVHLARFIEALRPWAMTEVYMLGVFVAVVKLSDMATIYTGAALWAFSALILIIAAMVASYDGRLLWKELEQTT